SWHSLINNHPSHRPQNPLTTTTRMVFTYPSSPRSSDEQLPLPTGEAWASCAAVELVGSPRGRERPSVCYGDPSGSVSMVVMFEAEV
ncbi:hypothetical protein BDV23DRAFT_149615, partial [Aspergillus alliaceus]